MTASNSDMGQAKAAMKYETDKKFEKTSSLLMDIVEECCASLSRLWRNIEIHKTRLAYLAEQDIDEKRVYTSIHDLRADVEQCVQPLKQVYFECLSYVKKFSPDSYALDPRHYSFEPFNAEQFFNTSIYKGCVSFELERKALWNDLNSDGSYFAWKCLMAIGDRNTRPQLWLIAGYFKNLYCAMSTLEEKYSDVVWYSDDSIYHYIEKSDREYDEACETAIPSQA